MKNILIDIVTKYRIDSVLEKLNKNAKNDLQIGFLGEFSSGKSTLINAIVNKKVLPAMDQPTSKSIVEIIAKDNSQDIEYYKIEDKNDIKIDASEFSKIALSNSNEKAKLKVPSNEFLKDGYMLIDTPGISSLDKSDVDITFGYLPFLDCAVICSHIDKGSLTLSVITFLLKPEIRPIINNFLFVITNAHLKNPQSREIIKRNILVQLHDLNLKYDLNIQDIENKVIVVSSLEAMENKKGFTLDELKNSFNKNFLLKKELLIKEKETRFLKVEAKNIVSLLRYKKENSKLDLSELEKAEGEIKNSIDKFQNDKKLILKKIDTLDYNISQVLNNIATKYLNDIKAVQNASDAEMIMTNMKEEIETAVNGIIKRELKYINITTNHNHFNELEILLGNLLSNIDIGKNIGMFLLAELATLGTAGIGGFFAMLIRGVTTNKFENPIFTALNQVVRPVDWISDKLSSSIISSKIEPKIKEISQKIAEEIEEEMRNIAQEELLIPLENKLKEQKNILNEIYNKKSKQKQLFNEDLTEIDDDILKINLMIEG